MENVFGDGWIEGQSVMENTNNNQNPENLM